MSKSHIVHMGQPSLVQAVSNCEKRAIGSNGGFGYKSLNEERIKKKYNNLLIYVAT